MENLFTILLLLISWRFSYLPPQDLLVRPTGYLQNYGFDQNDSERIAPFVKLLHDGAYKIEEVDDDHSSRKDTISYNIYSIGDSVAIEEQGIYNTKPGTKFTEKFSPKGKLLYRVSEHKSSSLGYFDSDGSWVQYKHLLPSSSNHWHDTAILVKKIIYDKLGRPIESDDYDEHDEFQDYGKIARKILYQYSNSSIETNDYVRKSGNRYNTTKTYKEYEKERRFGPVEYVIYNREFKKIDSATRSIETETYNYSQPYGDINIFKRTYDLIYYDKNWHPIKENIKRKYPGSKMLEAKIEYERDERGLLIKKITQWTDSKEEIQKWSYDKYGNCELHLDYDTRETWNYDEKGNLIKDNGGSYVKVYKIYYK